MPKLESFGAFGVSISTVFFMIFNTYLLMVLYVFFMCMYYIAGHQSYKIA